MDSQVSKVFQVSGQYKVITLLLALVLLALVIDILFDKPLPPHDPNLFFLIPFLGWSMFRGLANASLKITISPNAIVQSNWFGKKTIHLSSVRGIRKYYPTSVTGFSIVVQTDESELFLSNPLKQTQLNEMHTYILEQIRIYYPENYDVLNTERYEVKNFWRK